MSPKRHYTDSETMCLHTRRRSRVLMSCARHTFYRMYYTFYRMYTIEQSTYAIDRALYCAFDSERVLLHYQLSCARTTSTRSRHTDTSHVRRTFTRTSCVLVRVVAHNVCEYEHTSAHDALHSLLQYDVEWIAHSSYY
jgi:hypothetical protein